MVNDDAALVKRMLAGETDLFAGVIARHQAQVFGILHRYERDHQKLEDLAQETFVKAWRFLERFDGRAPFHHWLSKIALHTALDHLRRQKRLKPEIAMDELGEAALEWLHDPREDRQLETRSAGELLAMAMRELPALDQQVITLLEIEGRSVKEICGLMEISNASVRVRAFRARGRLRKILERLKGTT